VENKDAFYHTFVIEGHDVKLSLPASKARRVEANLKPGTYTFLCDVPGHEEVMRGTLTVQ
jgi:azurin